MFTATIKSSGRRFSVAADEPVLEAAQRAGIALPYSCRSGVCGSCKATLLQGACEYTHNPPVALSAGEMAHRAVLLCQATATSDLLLDVREVTSVEAIARRQLDVVVARKWPLASDAVGLHLLPAPGEAALNWVPGQYLDVVLEDGKHRPFSIANGPRPDGLIELHVRQAVSGGFTAWVYDSLKVGDTLRIEAPLGTFVPREDSERPMIFMAGGTGFAPIKAIVEHFLALGTRRPMDVYWGARSAKDIYLPGLADSWPRAAANLRFHAVVSDPAHTDPERADPEQPDSGRPAGVRRGLVHEAVLHDHPQLSGYDVYMSGPPAMIDAGRQLFVQAGLPEDRLYYDSFEYAPDVLAQILNGRAGIHHL